MKNIKLGELYEITLFHSIMTPDILPEKFIKNNCFVEHSTQNGSDWPFVKDKYSKKIVVFVLDKETEINLNYGMAHAYYSNQIKFYYKSLIGKDVYYIAKSTFRKKIS